MNKLKSALTKLARTSETLTEALESNNGFELMATNEKVAVDLREIRGLRSELRPYEDDTIIFIPPDHSFQKAIFNLGCVTASNGNNSAVSLLKLI